MSISNRILEAQETEEYKQWKRNTKQLYPDATFGVNDNGQAVALDPNGGSILATFYGTRLENF